MADADGDIWDANADRHRAALYRKLARQLEQQVKDAA
jgi:hypothetical protein